MRNADPLICSYNNLIEIIIVIVMRHVFDLIKIGNDEYFHLEWISHQKIYVLLLRPINVFMLNLVIS